MRRSFVLIPSCLVALAAVAASAAAQGRDNTVDPGMSKAQVIEHLGPPQSAKTSDTLTYLYYKNGCEKTCGMNDVVILAHDKVVDAIFRDPTRRYTGQSSSPSSLTAAEARKKGATMKAAATDTTKPTPAIVIPAPKAAPPPPPTAPAAAAVPAAAPAPAPAKADSTKPDSTKKPPRG